MKQATQHMARQVALLQAFATKYNVEEIAHWIRVTFGVQGWDYDRECFVKLVDGVRVMLSVTPKMSPQFNVSLPEFAGVPASGKGDR
jgi:hypothetical protein